MPTATASASEISSLVAPCSRAAAGMHSDAAVAAQADGSRECDQLAGLVAEATDFLARAPERDVALHRVGAQFGEIANSGDELPPVGVPVVQVHVELLSLVGKYDAAWRDECPRGAETLLIGSIIESRLRRRALKTPSAPSRRCSASGRNSRQSAGSLRSGTSRTMPSRRAGRSSTP